MASEVDGELVILFPASGKYYGLNKMSTWIWGLIQDKRTIDEIDMEIQREFLVDPDKSMADLVDILQKLADDGLVEVTNGPDL